MVEDSEATQTLPKLQELLPQSGDNALQRETVPNDQLRKDEIYQFNSNAVERNQRAKAVGQTVSGNLYKNADFAARDEAPVPTKESATDRSLATAKRTDREVASRSTVTKIDSATRGRSAQSSPVLTAGDGLMEGDAKFSFHSAPASAQSIMSANRSQKVKTGQMYATWLGGELFLIRQASRPIRSFPSNWDPGWNRHFNAPCIQGVWLDSRVLTANLLREVADLLPRARLVPAVDARSAADPLALVSFPFKLERGESPLATAISTIPGLGVPLWVAWGSVAFAFLTSALLVRGVLRLSERRASFVSAVTHELRTPLTTFRLYSDMLESGAVREEKRSSYLRVLSREADRLSHLVENVLAFSRIERGNARSMVREIPVGEMLESFRERFEARLTTAGMSLVMVPPPTRLIRVDTAVVEHILFNLIDNAAKYASSGSPRQVGIHVQESACGIDIRVEDHGPGIPVSERGRIFRAFHKSAREAAESQPGVGLGLSLSRRLARELGGQLECLDARTGACFSLKLPA
jgi:signal transduction histidine kinase